MDNLKNKLLDILLFPARLYEKLSDRKATLAAGIVLVGVIDFFLPDVMYIIKKLFFGKTLFDIIYNAGMAVLVLLLLGFIDVICMSVPLFDISVYLKRKEAQFIMNTGIGAKEQQPALDPSAIKVMKAYIMSHFIMVPVSIIFNYVLSLDVFGENPAFLQTLAGILFIVIMIWSAAIMTRGINSLFRFSILFRRLVFMIVFAWNSLFGMVFDIMIVDWLMRLFR
ncbi:MAG TPA: hypothetical protein PK767_00415 [Clostridiales bacterium]|nr:hypothetical protein [Clostridiales bacterium]